MNLYIHVPFCAVKCGYCAFYSESGVSAGVVDAYLDKLESVIQPEAVDTVYIGGGTPTLLALPQLRRLISILEERLSFAPDAEISIEANPETLDEPKVALLREFFTRISLGVQSFDPELRRRIGRKCSEKALHRALQLIKEAQFPHWNCDLIYSLPDETLDEWRKDLYRAGESGCDHVSCYSLTPERAALLGETFLADDLRERIMYDEAGRILATCGIKRYEISNYAVPGGECRHNLNVWRGDVLRGYGPAAADFDGIDRHIQVENLTEWLNGAMPETDHITHEARLNEIFAVNLRTVAGWNAPLWEKVPGADSWSERVARVSVMQEKYSGCWLIDEAGVRLSAEGLLFWNDIAAELL